MTPEVLCLKRRLNGSQNPSAKSYVFKLRVTGAKEIFTRPPKKAFQKNLQAFAGFCLWMAKVRLAQPSTLWQDRAVQNQKPTAIAFQFLRGFVGSNPIPTGGNAPPASVASAFAGHATGEFAARPDFADSSSCSHFRTGTVGGMRLPKVRNSERRFSLPALALSGRVVTEAAFSIQRKILSTNRANIHPIVTGAPCVRLKDKQQ